MTTTAVPMSADLCDYVLQQVTSSINGTLPTVTVFDTDAAKEYRTNGFAMLHGAGLLGNQYVKVETERCSGCAYVRPEADGSVTVWTKFTDKPL